VFYTNRRIVRDRSKAGKSVVKRLWGSLATAPKPTKSTRIIFMRLKLLLPEVEPTKYEKPGKCLRKGCCGQRLYPRQAVSKRVVDGKHPVVTAWRYECAKCGCTLRVYPQRVSKKQISKRVNGMAVMLYVLGLSYGAVEIVLESLGVGIGKKHDVAYRLCWKPPIQWTRPGCLDGISLPVSSLPDSSRFTNFGQFDNVTLNKCSMNDLGGQRQI
jgi:hypothetical protein